MQREKGRPLAVVARRAGFDAGNEIALDGFGKGEFDGLSLARRKRGVKRAEHGGVAHRGGDIAARERAAEQLRSGVVRPRDTPLVADQEERVGQAVQHAADFSHLVLEPADPLGAAAVEPVEPVSQLARQRGNPKARRGGVVALEQLVEIIGQRVEVGLADQHGGEAEKADREHRDQRDQRPDMAQPGEHREQHRAGQGDGQGRCYRPADVKRFACHEPPFKRVR